MLRRTLFLSVVAVSLAFSIEAQQQGQPKQTKRPITSVVNDSGGTELIVRLLDIGQGDATYIRNGSSRIIIDGGPDTARFGRYLDSLDLNNSTIDVVILSHQHLDHYSGLRELFRASRNIRVRYFFENKDPAPAVTLAKLRDSILSRMDHDSLVYNVLKANHHGSCNGVTPRYLALVRPEWLVASLGARNGFGHMHQQAKNIYRRTGVPWYRTDQNGTITIRSPGTLGGGFTITPERRGADLDGPGDRFSAQAGCAAGRRR